MKKVLLSLLAVIVVLGLFAAVGYAGYRLGYARGLQATANSNATRPQPPLHPFDDFGPRGMQRFGFERGFGRGGFPMIGFFFPLIFIGRLVILALIIWFIYWLFTRSGWRLTRATQTIAPPPPGTEGGNQDIEAKQ